MSNVTPPVLPGVGNPVFPALMSFDGHRNQDLGAQPQLNDLTSGFTVAAWVNPFELGRRQRIIALERPGGFSLGIDGAKLIFTTFGIRDYIGSREVLSSNELTHVVAVMDSNFSVQFYVNGEFIETVEGNRPGNPSAGNTYLGGLENETELLFGDIRDVRAYDVELTPDQIVMLARV